MAKPLRTWGGRTYTLGPRAGGCLLALVGLVPLVIGATLGWNTLSFLPGTVTTTGTIVSCQMVPIPNNPGTNCEPTVRFRTQAGQTITFKSSMSSAEFYVGEAVTVKYHPNHPQDARLNDEIFWLFFVGLGLVSVLVGLVLYLRGLISKTRE